MKEKILSLAKGQFTYETPELVLEPRRLEMHVMAGGKYTAAVRVSNARGTKVKGFGVAEEQEIEFLPVFDAAKSEMEITVDASNIPAGEHLQGNLYLVTDCGETVLPYDIVVEAPKLKDEKGDITDYQMLLERIKEDVENGMNLFYSEEFREQFLYRDQAGELLYQHLTAKNTRLQGMEEFLVAMGKKKAMSFYVTHPKGGRTEPVEYEMEGKDIRDSVKIRIRTWGNTAIRVSSTADFIRPELHLLWPEEFEKDMVVFDYTLLADRVQNGAREGVLIFESPYERQEIRIRARQMEGAKERKVGRAKQAVFATLYRMYLAYREGRVSKEELQNLIWNNRRIILKIEHTYQLPIRGFIPAMLRDSQGMLAFYQEAEKIEIPKEGAPLAEVENYILIQYAKFLYSKREEDRENIDRMLQAYAELGYSSLLLFYLKLHTDPSYQMVPKKLQDIREQIENGINSPLLYSELVRLYIEEPTRISELDSATVAVINYGLKEDLITKDMSLVISFLAERSARFRPTVLRMMIGIYEKFHTEDMLRAICSLLIRNEQQGSRYFPWFEEGVKAHLRITDLFEYYMYSMDRDNCTALPQAVLSYFQYENHLNASCKAFLFAYIIRHKEELSEYFEAYEPVIREFAHAQLSCHRISADMGTIYEAVFGADQITDTVAEDLPHVMFTELLTCRHPEIEGVMVVHVEAKEENYYPIVAGTAKIMIYTPNYQLYFVDREGHYYCGSVEYELQKLLHMDEYAGLCYQNGATYVPLLISLAVQAWRRARLMPWQAELLYEVSGMDILRDYAKGKFLLCLYDYYKKEKDVTGILNVLDEWQIDLIKKERLSEIASDCVYYGMYDRAEEMFLKQGVRGCDKKALSMLISEKIQERKDDFSPVLVKWSIYLFREHYYEWAPMYYLLKYFMGETKTLTSIYHKCEELSQGAAIEDGCKERVLGQVLFTGADVSSYESLFLDYYESGTNRVLVKAFLAQMAYSYVVGRVELSEPILVKIEKEAYYEKSKVMSLAALRYYSGRKIFDKKQKDFIELELENFAGEGLILDFMKQFIGKVAVPFEIENLVVVQHYSGTDKGVFLFFQNGEDERSEGQPMKRVFDGIYTKELLLFADEEKRAYVYEEEDDRRFGEVILRPPVQEGGTDGFYTMLNKMIESAGDSQSYSELRREYLRRYQLADKLFTAQK